MSYVIDSRFTTVLIGLISGYNETAYSEEVEVLSTWCQDNNFRPECLEDSRDGVEMVTSEEKQRCHWRAEQ